MYRRARLLTAAAALLSVAGAGMVTAAPSTAAATSGVVGSGSFAGNEGTYTAVPPSRVLDTRSGAAGNPKGAIGAAKAITVKVGGKAGVPTTASAVVLNLTVTQPSVGGYLTAYPAGKARPLASSINFPRGWTGANLVTVPLGTAGAISLYNSAGTTHAVADVLGYYAGSSTATKGGEYLPIDPMRLIDTRTEGDGPLQPADAYRLSLGNGSLEGRVTAVAVNVTVTAPQSGGYVTTWAGGWDDKPSTSALNFGASQTVSNMAIIPTRDCDGESCELGDVEFWVANGSAGSLDLIVDLVGVYDEGVNDLLRFRPVTPTRIADTRQGNPGPALGAGTVRTVNSPATVAGDATLALVSNVTAIAPTDNTYLTLYAAGATRPGVSNLNPMAGRTVANAAVPSLGKMQDGDPGNAKFSIYNRKGTVNVAIDVSGSLELNLTPSGKAAARSFAAFAPVDPATRLRERSVEASAGLARAGATSAAVQSR